jgi:hypothetical protein
MALPVHPRRARTALSDLLKATTPSGDQGLTPGADDSNMAILPPVSVPGQRQCPKGHAVTPEQHFCPDCGLSIQPPAPNRAPGWYPDPGNQAQQRFWNGSAWTGPGVRSILEDLTAQRFAPQTSGKTLPAAGKPAKGVLAPILVGLSIIAFAIGAVMLFSAPHATYAYFPPGGSAQFVNGNEVQSVATTPCISAWNYWQGNFNTRSNPNQFPDVNASSNANAACTGVIHGREHLSVLLIVLAVILGVTGGVTFCVRRRT